MRFFLFVIIGLALIGSSCFASSFDEARLLYKKGKIDQAILLLKSENSPNAENFALLGTLLSLKDKEEEALTYYIRAAELEPESAKYLNNVAITYTSLLKEKEAKEWFKKVLKVDPQNKRALEYLKSFEFSEKENQQMIQNMERALQPVENKVEEYLQAGNVFYKVHQWDLAEKYFKEADSRNPNLYWVKKRLAWLAYRRSDLKQAVFYWEEGQKLEPNKPEPFVEAARLYSAMAQYRQAALCWNRVDQLAKDGDEIKQEAQYYLKSLEPFLKQKTSVP